MPQPPHDCDVGLAHALHVVLNFGLRVRQKGLYSSHDIGVPASMCSQQSSIGLTLFTPCAVRTGAESIRGCGPDSGGASTVRGWGEAGPQGGAAEGRRGD